MRSPVVPLLGAGLSALLFLTPTAAGHGGTYKAPPGAPGAPVPNPKTGLPGPGTGPTYGGSPVAPGTPGGAPGTPGGLPDTGVDRVRWTWWWEFHREPYLELKRHVFTGAPTSGDGGFLGGGSRTAPVLRPTPARIRTEVLPALYATLETAKQTDLVSSALIAVARVADDLEDLDQRAAADRIRPFLRSNNHEIAEAAVLALGILGHEPSAPLLSALMADESYGRSLLGQERVTFRVRAFAAYGLGLLGAASEREDVRRYVVHQLAATLEAVRGAPQVDLEAACILSLGLVPLADGGVAPEEGERRPVTAGRGAQVAYLEELLRDKKRETLVRAQVPLSLARLARGGAVAERAKRTLVERLAPMRRERREVVQSAIVGLGLLADNDTDPLDQRVRNALMGVDADHADRGARFLARISLARIGARPGTGEAKGLNDARRFLLRDLSRGKAQERPWAALALGVLERGRLDRGSMPDAGVTLALRSALDGAKAPDEVGALAVALGLVRDASSSDLLASKLDRLRDDEGRGQLALALGMVGARDQAVRLRPLVGSAVFRPLLLKEASTGLALLGEKETVPYLIDLLGEARSLSSQASLAQAVGRIGDARAIAPLVQMIQDRDLTDRARAFAAVALGLVGDLDPLPWHVPLAEHGNHLAAPPTLYDDVGRGILNLL